MAVTEARASGITPGERARRVAERSFEPGSPNARRLAEALELLGGTSAAGVVEAIDTDELRIEVGAADQGGAGMWESPWRPDRLLDSLQLLRRGERPTHRIVVDEQSMSDPRELAALVAHEGTHYQVSQRPLVHLPVVIGGYLAGVAAFALSLPTLGMLDLTGRRHAIGAGATAAAMQGAQLVSGMSHENHAYRVGDRAAVELGLEHNGYVLDDEDRELGTLEGGWKVASDYMQVAGDTVTPEDATSETPTVPRMLVMPALGLAVGGAAYLGARRVGLSPPLARAVTFGPGLAAFGYRLLSADRG